MFDPRRGALRPRLPCGSAACCPQIPSSAVHFPLRTAVYVLFFFFLTPRLCWALTSPDWIPPLCGGTPHASAASGGGVAVCEKCWHEFGTMQITLLSSVPPLLRCVRVRVRRTKWRICMWKTGKMHLCLRSRELRHPALTVLQVSVWRNSRIIPKCDFLEFNC